MNTALGELDLDRVIDLCQKLVVELQAVKDATFGEMIYALTVTVAKMLALKGAPRAAQHFKTGMAKPLALVADPSRAIPCNQAIVKFNETLNETDLNDLPAICAMCAATIAEVAVDEAHGNYIRQLWKETLLIVAAECREKLYDLWTRLCPACAPNLKDAAMRFDPRRPEITIRACEVCKPIIAAAFQKKPIN